MLGSRQWLNGIDVVQSPRADDQVCEDADVWLEGEVTKDVKEITVEDMFKLALAASKRGTMARRDWDDARDKFFDWMKTNYPYIRTWVKLRRQHARPAQ